MTGNGFGDNFSITHRIFGNSLTLGCVFAGADHDSDILVVGVNSVGIAPKTVLDLLVSEIFDHISRISCLSGMSNVVVSASNRMRLLRFWFEKIKVSLLSKYSICLVALDQTWLINLAKS